MFRNLRRVVWLTAAQRDIVLSCAQLAAERVEDFRGKEEMFNLTSYLETVKKSKYPRRQVVVLTINGLKLPHDSLPIWLTDEEIDLLTVWGNLPRTVGLYAKPDACIFENKAISEKTLTNFEQDLQEEVEENVAE